MKDLSQYIAETEEEYCSEWDYAAEMTNIGYPVLDRKQYNISVHGLNANERIRPHLHIYLADDHRPFSKFNFEIALEELICYDELNLLTMIDKNKNISKTNRNNCSWNGYLKLRDDFEDWLYSPSEKKGDFIDNLDAAIYFYNEESGYNKNALLEYVRDHGLTVLKKFEKYFNEEDRQKYKECFE